MSWVRTIAQSLRGGSLRRGTAILGGGAAISLVLTYLTQIILTRLFSAGDFGVADSFVSLVAILSPIVSLRYEDAILLPESERESRTVLQLAGLLLAVGSTVVMLISVLLGSAIGSALGSEALGRYLPLLAAGLILHRSNELLELWTSRRKAYGVISKAQVARTTATAGIRLGAGFSGAMVNAGGLIIGFIAGFAVSTVLLLRNAHQGAQSVVSGFSLKRAKIVALRYKRFPFFSMPANLLGSLNARLPFLLLLFFFSEEAVGYFGRAFVAIAIPLSMVGTAVSRVFFVEASEQRRSGDLSGLTTVVYDKLVSVALIPIVAILIAGPELFSLVFGKAWIEAGVYAQILAPWFALIGITSPLTRVFDVLQRQRLDLLISCVSFAAVSSSLIAGGMAGSLDQTLWYVTIAGCSTRLLQLGIILHLGQVSISKTIWPWIKYAASLAPLGVLLTIVRNAGPGALILGLGGGLLIHGAIVVLLQIRTDARRVS